MAEAVELPIEVEGLDGAVAQLQRLNNTVKQGAKESAKELGEVEKMMRRQLSADVLSQGITKLGGSMKGTAGQALDLLSVGVQGFGSGGPWGAAFAIATSAVSLVIDEMEKARQAALKLQQTAVDAQTARVSAAKEAQLELEKQNRLLEVERELRAEGKDVSEAASIVASEMLQRRVDLATQELLDIEAKLDASASSVETARRRIALFGEETSVLNSDAANRDITNARKVLDEYEKLQDRRIAVDADLTALRLRNEADVTAGIRAMEAGHHKERTDRAAELDRLRAASDAALIARANIAAAAIAAREKEEIAAAARKEARLLAAEEAEDERRRAARDAPDATGILDSSGMERTAELTASAMAAAQLADELERINESERLSSEWLRSLESTAKDAFSAIASGAGDAVASLAMYSAASASASEASSVGAAETVANMATEVQAFLAAKAKEATIEALMHGAAAIGAVAYGRYDQAVEHGLAALKYGAIAGGAALAGAGIGKIRGENTQEREDREGRVDDAASLPGSTGSGGSSASGGTTGKSEVPPIILNVGAGVFTTRDELGRDMKLLLEMQNRRA